MSAARSISDFQDDSEPFFLGGVAFATLVVSLAASMGLTNALPISSAVTPSGSGGRETLRFSRFFFFTDLFLRFGLGYAWHL